MLITVISYRCILTLNYFLRTKTSNIDGIGVFTVQEISQDKELFKIIGKTTPHATKYTIQVDAGIHLTALDTIVHFNHSCVPNCFIDFKNMVLKPIRNITSGEELTFHYCTTELELESSFKCNCLASNCLGEIKGFKFLDRSYIDSLRPYLSPFLSDLL